MARRPGWIVNPICIPAPVGRARFEFRIDRGCSVLLVARGSDSFIAVIAGIAGIAGSYSYGGYANLMHLIQLKPQF